MIFVEKSIQLRLRRRLAGAQCSPLFYGAWTPAIVVSPAARLGVLPLETRPSGVNNGNANTINGFIASGCPGATIGFGPPAPDRKLSGTAESGSKHHAEQGRSPALRTGAYACGVPDRQYADIWLRLNFWVDTHPSGD